MIFQTNFCKYARSAPAKLSQQQIDDFLWANKICEGIFTESSKILIYLTEMILRNDRSQTHVNQAFYIDEIIRNIGFFFENYA